MIVASVFSFLALLVEASLPVQHARIIHRGTNVERFRSIRERKYVAGHLKLLYAGHPDYEAFLHELVEQERLARHVTFHKPVSKDQMYGEIYPVA